jgi:hypothetical protein
MEDIRGYQTVTCNSANSAKGAGSVKAPCRKKQLNIITRSSKSQWKSFLKPAEYYAAKVKTFYEKLYGDFLA